VKAGCLESHKSFSKLSFEIYYKKLFNLDLLYGELKFEK
jgi:hypothetical protein